MTYPWQDCSIAIFPPFFIIPFRLPHLIVHSPLTGLTGSHFTTPYGTGPWSQCPLFPSGICQPFRKSPPHPAPWGGGRNYFGCIYFSLLKSYYDIYPLILSLSVNAGFSNIHIYLFFPHLFLNILRGTDI